MRDALEYIPEDASAVEFFKATPMLTVWRHLYVEYDKMAATPQYTVGAEEAKRLVYGPENGNITDLGVGWIADAGSSARWGLHPNLYNDDNAVYVRPDPPDNYYYPIDSLASQRINVTRDVRVYDGRPTSWGRRPCDPPVDLTQITDIGEGYVIYTEDEKIDPELPPLDVATEAFEQCYVEIEDSPYKGTVHNWIRNLTDNELTSMGDDNRVSDAHYWNVYVLGAYEYLQSEDNDPDTVPPGEITIGCTLYGLYSAVFYETIRDGEGGQITQERLARVTAHEIGHQFELAHNEDELWHIMHPDLEYMGDAFNNIDKAKIRSKERP